MGDGYRWHLDGWDREGGRAFATRRPRGADLAENRADFGPTVYIGPPDFLPEQIGSTSVALSASRAAYFVESVPPFATAENELGFPTANAVAEFVRLAFVGNGRNRGGGGEGAAPGEPNLPRSPEGMPPEDDALWSYFHETALLRKKLQSLREESALPIASVAKGLSRGVREEGVESGALQLIRAHLEARVHGSPAEAWPSAHTTLHRAMVELQIWQEWLDRPETDPRSIRNAEYLWEPVRALLGFPEDAKPDLKNPIGVIAAAHQCSLPSARLSPGFIDYARLLLHSSERANTFYTYAAFGMPPDSFDRYAPMFSWRLPNYLARADKTVTSVGGLLAAFIAWPERVRQWPGATDIVRFSAALLASRLEDRMHPGWRGRAASNWLARSVPRHVFSADVEALIWS